MTSVRVNTKIVEAFHDLWTVINSGLHVIITLLHTQVMKLKTTYLCIRTFFFTCIVSEVQHFWWLLLSLYLLKSGPWQVE